jgi:DNA repair protein RadC
MSHANSLFTLDAAGRQVPASADQVIAAARQHIAHRFRRGASLTSPTAVRDFLRLRLGTREFETFCCLFLDNRHRLIEFVELFRGTIDAASVHPREVAKEALARNAAAVIFVHPHPSGVAEPSPADELITRVSVPDLYYEIGYHRWKLSGTIPAPGRLNRVSELDDPFFHLVEDSGLPITLKEIGRLLDTVTRILERAFRAKARQASSKSRISSISALKNVIEDAAKRSRLRQIASRLPQALLPLMNKTSMSNILYERFRCEAIHGASVRIDANRFFSEPEVYWKRIYPIYQGRTYELVEFPAAFLLECLKACIGAYRTHLLAKGNVPHAIYFHGFEDLLSTVHFLDSESMPEGGAVRLKLPK